MESILVTGGAGFVGSQLIKKLLQDYPNTEIISLDNYSTGSRANHQAGAIYIEGNTWEIAELFEAHRFDKIFHLGEYSRVSQSFEDYEVASQSILYGTAKCLKFAADTGAHLIYSATSSAHSEAGESLSPYSWMKAKQVEQIKHISNWYGLDWTICYLYNVWGEGQISTGKWATVIGIWEEAQKANRPIEVRGQGKQKRRFTHIDAVVEGLLLAANEAPNQEWHLAHPEEWTLLEAAQLFGDPHLIAEVKGDRQEARLPKGAKAPANWNPGLSLSQNRYAQSLSLEDLEEPAQKKPTSFLKKLFS